MTIQELHDKYDTLFSVIDSLESVTVDQEFDLRAEIADFVAIHAALLSSELEAKLVKVPREIAKRPSNHKK